MISTAIIAICNFSKSLYTIYEPVADYFHKVLKTFDLEMILQ